MHCACLYLAVRIENSPGLCKPRRPGSSPSPCARAASPPPHLPRGPGTPPTPGQACALGQQVLRATLSPPLHPQTPTFLHFAPKSTSPAAPRRAENAPGARPATPRARSTPGLRRRRSGADGEPRAARPAPRPEARPARAPSRPRSNRRRTSSRPGRGAGCSVTSRWISRDPGPPLKPAPPAQPPCTPPRSCPRAAVAAADTSPSPAAGAASPAAAAAEAAVAAAAAAGRPASPRGSAPPLERCGPRARPRPRSRQPLAAGAARRPPGAPARPSRPPEARPAVI
ncbi:uncharacterized protein [Eschrichtius robustus]|uniref:uncharacterized protein n=1 Tax=Eschrichtius robustus TaxID=9764 RepID=UPI0035BFAB17